MTRRVSLPGVDELFRSSGSRSSEAPLGSADVEASRQGDTATAVAVLDEPAAAGPGAPDGASLGGVEESSKRPRHEEKVTFYCTPSDLTRIEAARLTLRADHKLASDRGRIVRAALAEILDDFDRRGPDSALVQRLRQG